METHKKGITNRIKWIYKLISHGLFLHGVRNNFAKIGLDFMPYYWCKANIDKEFSKKAKDIAPNFKFSQFSNKEIQIVKSSIAGIESKDLLSDLENGDLCFGVKEGDEIVGYMFIRKVSFWFKKKYFVLGENDCYMHSMYVFDKYRGNNISPFLRYKSCELMKYKGVINHYSLVEYFNKPAIKVQKKANINFLSLNLAITLFKRWTFNYTLKSY